MPLPFSPGPHFSWVWGHQSLPELPRGYLSSHQPQLCPCLATEPAGPASVVADPSRGSTCHKSAGATQAPCGTSCWQEPPNKSTPASALKLGVETQSCIATATMFQLTCKNESKAFPPALPATTTGLISAPCSQA